MSETLPPAYKEWRRFYAPDDWQKAIGDFTQDLSGAANPPIKNNHLFPLWSPQKEERFGEIPRYYLTRKIAQEKSFAFLSKRIAKH